MGKNTVRMLRKTTILLVLAAMIAVAMPARAQADSLGIDVSRWQGTIDWNATSTLASFAIIKAGGSDGEFYTDSQFYRNRDEVRRLGMQRGYYYFAGGGNPIQEAEHFVSIVGPLQPGEVLALDYEIDRPDPVGYSMAFLIRTTELTGTKPLLYTNMNRVWGLDWRPVADSGYHLWGAIYDEDPINFQGGGAWPRATIKQYSSAGQVPGISANTVDMNVFRGTVEFTEMGYKPPAPPPPPVPVEPAPPLPASETPVSAGVPATGDAAGEETVHTLNVATGEDTAGEGQAPPTKEYRITGRGYAGTADSGDWKQKLLDSDIGLEQMVTGAGAEATARCLLGISCSDAGVPRANLELIFGPLAR